MLKNFLSSMQCDETESIVQFSRVGLENVLNPNCEYDVEEQITIEQLRFEISSVSDDALNDNVCQHESSQP